MRGVRKPPPELVVWTWLKRHILDNEGRLREFQTEDPDSLMVPRAISNKSTNGRNLQRPIIPIGLIL